MVGCKKLATPWSSANQIGFLVFVELTPAECTKYQLSFANLLRKFLKLPIVKTHKAKRT